jgi:hypothetical protein
MTVTNIGVQRPSTALRRSDGLSAIASLRHHWPEYLMEVGELGLYLFVACVVTTLLEHPASIVRQSISGGVARSALMGLVMGATAIAIVISPWGKRSGGHFNPAITFTFYGLGKRTAETSTYWEWAAGPPQRLASARRIKKEMSSTLYRTLSPDA